MLIFWRTFLQFFCYWCIIFFFKNENRKVQQKLKVVIASQKNTLYFYFLLLYRNHVILGKSGWIKQTQTILQQNIYPWNKDNHNFNTMSLLKLTEHLFDVLEVSEENLNFLSTCLQGITTLNISIARWFNISTSIIKQFFNITFGYCL